MRGPALLMAAALSFCAATASASPFATGPSAVGSASVVEVHHKPGHAGGPPWTRRNKSREDWLADRRYERGYSSGYPERRTVCRTTYRTYYDDYLGDYVRRRVRICD